jgi:steroid 5-alpha reductase family enzyme
MLEPHPTEKPFLHIEGENSPDEEKGMAAYLFGFRNEIPVLPLRTSAFILGCIYSIIILGAWILFDHSFINIQNKVLESFVVNVLLISLTFFFSLFFHNSSISDPYWILEAVGFSFYWWALSPYDTIAGQLALIAISVYAAKHFCYYFRSWTGLNYEDFRMRKLREEFRDHPILYWLVISLFGIHLFPLLLAFGGVIPVYYIVSAKSITRLWLLIAGFAISAGGLILETVADEQLHSHKLKRGPEALDNGLWAYSRHPNYLGEAIFWWGLYIMLMACDPTRYWWTFFGPLALNLLLYFPSVQIMENHLLLCKLGYADYQRKVSRFMFWKRQMV